MEKRFTIVAISVISLVLLLLVLAVQVISSNINVKKADIILRNIAEKNSDMFFDKSESMGFIDMESIKSFSVVISQDGTSEAFVTNGTGFIDKEIALSMTLAVVDEDSNTGFIDGFRYLIVKEEDIVSVYFLDYSFEQESARNFLLISLAVYALLVLLVGILVKIFMKFVMRPIKESYEKQKQFITDASHELKTPLTIIATDMQLIEMESGSTKWVKSVNKQVERLTMLSNDLVVLSRMDEKSNQLKLKELDLSDLVSDVVYGFEPALLATGKELQTEITDGIRIYGDYDALEKVMFILMENSLKYSSKDALIRVKLWKKNKGFGLLVENTVPFIDEGSHNEFFERFYRGDKSRNSKIAGFGIGLAVAKSIVEQHNGQIEAYSPDCERIVFKIDL
ncbi:sensor histidine kinase [Clostridium grantii]|nr:HAMP domain-containing sensor histidine kinase [Clostridium grantii]